MIIINAILYALLIAILWCVAVVIILLVVYGNEFKRLWQEPMLRFPVVIFDSDDWGVGPKEQVSALVDLLQLFSQYYDEKQHHPVLTLGVVLAEPDVEKIAEQIKANEEHYFYRDLSNEVYRDLVQIIKKGQEQAVFAIHLHGMEHFWPPSLMNQLQRKDVKQWLFSSGSDSMVEIKARSTENLPSFLQSRWCDTSTLPSAELTAQEIEKAIKTEENCFKKVFAQAPKVVVPPTFVWTEQVIKYYVLHNIRLFITPGRQFTGRNADGSLQLGERTFFNGECDKNGACYLVRDIYFEPEKGHKAERVMKDIINRTDTARPSLIEMHRYNFLLNKEHSLKELKCLLDNISEQLPKTLYLSAEQLADIYQSNNGEMLFKSFSERLQIWLKRIQLFLQYKRLAKYTGFNNVFVGATITALPIKRFAKTIIKK